MQDLQNKKAIVTGGAQGLGLAMAEGLLEEGVKVCIVDRSNKVAEVTEALQKKGYDACYIQADLGNLAQLNEVFESSLNELGGELDILVNNAGIHKPMPAEQLPIEDFERILNVNVSVVFELSRLAARKMLEKKAGKIINIASVLSIQGGFKASAYSTSKGAVALLTKSLSNEWASKGIQVNAIAPGYFNTELNQFIIDDPERLQSLVDRIPVGRFGDPKELAGAVQFLASSKSNYVNGIVLPVDGGFLGR